MSLIMAACLDVVACLVAVAAVACLVVSCFLIYTLAVACLVGGGATLII